MTRYLLSILSVLAAAAVVPAVGATPPNGATMEEASGSTCCPPPGGADARTVRIVWERLVVADGGTCPRCGETGDELDNAAAQLGAALTPLGVRVAVEKRELTTAEFEAEPTRSNRVWVNGRLVEDWLGGDEGQSPCCDACGDAECRTVAVDGEIYEAVPADLIVRAGLAAAAALPAADTPAPGGCCPAR